MNFLKKSSKDIKALQGVLMGDRLRDKDTGEGMQVCSAVMLGFDQ